LTLTSTWYLIPAPSVTVGRPASLAEGRQARPLEHGVVRGGVGRHGCCQADLPVRRIREGVWRPDWIDAGKTLAEVAYLQKWEKAR
jgi:hypothetical protein